ncbi:MAG TPA: hypothetical protein VGU20_08150 [Stellaceae bacterium]|nr:hypothetical protein [Stellaceae bacterium]
MIRGACDAREPALHELVLEPAAGDEKLRGDAAVAVAAAAVKAQLERAADEARRHCRSRLLGTGLAPARQEDAERYDMAAISQRDLAAVEYRRRLDGLARFEPGHLGCRRQREQREHQQDHGTTRCGG